MRERERKRETERKREKEREKKRRRKGGKIREIPAGKTENNKGQRRTGK